MTYGTIQQCLDADARTNVRAAIPNFVGVADKVTVGDAENMWIAETYGDHDCQGEDGCECQTKDEAYWSWYENEENGATGN